MTSTMTLGLIVTVIAGIAIGIQPVFTSLIGQTLSPVNSGLAIHIGGTVAGAIMVMLIFLTNPNLPQITLTPRVTIFSILAGTTGMIIIMGITFAFQHVGFVTGQGILIVTQLTVAVVVDTFALTGGQPMPLDWRRVLGIAVLVLGTYLIIPRQTA